LVLDKAPLIPLLGGGFISDALIRAFKSLAHPAHLQSPISDRAINQQIQAFVDHDTRTLLTTNQITMEDVVTTLMAILHQDSQSWERILHASSGKLELEKCRFGLFIWDYDTQGIGTLRQCAEKLSLQDSETGKTLSVPQIQPSEAYKYLGVHIAMDGNMVAQKKALQEKCSKFISIFAQCQLSQSNMQLIYRTVFVPAIKYVFPATTIDAAFLENIQKPIITLVLSRIGFNSHMPREVVFAPIHFGGLGLLDLTVEQGLSQVLFILSQVRGDTTTSATIFILLETYQTVTGIDMNPLEDTGPCSYVDAPWVHNVRSFLHQCNAKIALPALKITHPLRQNDKTLMAVARNQGFTPQAMNQINQCRVFLQVMYLSEICNDNGKHLLRRAIEGTVDQNNQTELSTICSSTLEWPAQPRLSTSAWNQWKLFLGYFTGGNVYSPLLTPLGPWLATSSPVRRWRYQYCAQSHTIISNEPQGPCQFTEASSRTRYGHVFIRTNLAPVPLNITVPVTPISITKDMVTIGVLLHSAPTPLAGSYEREDPITYDYIEPNASQLLSEASTITVSSDGGLLYDQATFGGIISADNTPVIQISGKAPAQNWPSSLTAEAFGAYYTSKTLTAVLPSNTTRPRLRFLADNQSLLAGLSYRHKCANNPTQSLQPEHELLRATISQVQWFHDLSFQHVKSHQNSSSSPEAKLNNDCDRLATMARQYPTPPGPVLLPSRSATLLLNGLEVTSKYADHLRAAYSSQDLCEYYMKKFPK
jgi:hypothetical protein